MKIIRKSYVHQLNQFQSNLLLLKQPLRPTGETKPKPPRNSSTSVVIAQNFDGELLNQKVTSIACTKHIRILEKTWVKISWINQD